jgi:hypothetical protein
MAAVFIVGEVVRLEGLKFNPSLNGAMGTIMKDVDSESRGRYSFQLHSPASAVAEHPSGMSLKPVNLIKVIECV